MDQKLSEQPGEFVINLQPRFYGLSYDNVTQFEASYTEEQLLQRAKRLKNQQRRRVRQLLLALTVVTVCVVVMIVVYSIIVTSREYYGGATHRRNWWWSFFRRKLSESDKQRVAVVGSGVEGGGKNEMVAVPAGGEVRKSGGKGEVPEGSVDAGRAEEEAGGGTAADGADDGDDDAGGGGDGGTDTVGKTWLRACDNSKQGRTYVTDERGYVCRWDQMYSGAGYGCCWESERTNISRYSCQLCDTATSCCLEYEFCVSCCMNPTQEQRVDSWLRLNIGDPRDRDEVAALSRFEECLALCRTSSASILRQHVFVSPAHFCYAAAAPAG